MLSRFHIWIGLTCAFCVLGSESVGRAELLVLNADEGSISKVSSSGVVSPFSSTFLNTPIQMAVTGSGDVLVSTYGDGSVERFSSTGAYLGTLLLVPQGFQRSAGGIAISGSNDLYVGGGDFGSSSISRYSVDGSLINTFATIPYVQQPSGELTDGASFFNMAFDKNGVLVATDDLFNRLYRFGTDGSLLTEVQFSHQGAYGLAIDNDGHIFVGMSAATNRIDEYNNDGTLMRTFVANMASTPTGMVFDKDGNLLVSLYEAGVIEKFDANGNDLGIYASGLAGPTGLAFELETQAVPEPSSMALLIVAGICGAGYRARRVVRSRK